MSEAPVGAAGPPRRLGRAGIRERINPMATLRTLVALALAVGALAILIGALGADPGSAMSSMISASLGNKFNLGQTLMIASILALTGLAAAIPFAARLWNIGGEGQLYFGAFAAAGLGVMLPASLSSWIMIPLLLIASFVAGGLWAAVPGVLKAVINANEVIVSLMMTFIALNVADYGITVLWPQGSAPQTKYLPHSALLPNIWSGTLITLGAPIALAVIIGAWVLMSRTATGFSIRAIGLNPRAARMGGISIPKITMISFVVGGGFAGLAGGIAVTGINGALISGFSGDFGYIGIAVALLARLSPAWIVPSAMFFAILREGSNGLEVTNGLSPDVGEFLVAIFIILLLAFKVIRLRYAEAQT